jgi:hypothetical protein
MNHLERIAGCTSGGATLSFLRLTLVADKHYRKSVNNSHPTIDNAACGSPDRRLGRRLALGLAFGLALACPNNQGKNSTNQQHNSYSRW